MTTAEILSVGLGTFQLQYYDFWFGASVLQIVILPSLFLHCTKNIAQKSNLAHTYFAIKYIAEIFLH